MTKTIKIKKGLDIGLEGKPQESIRNKITSPLYQIFPDDFPGVVAKVSVRPGDTIKAGDPVLYDKNRPELKIVSPVSGEIVAVDRGEKRKLLSVSVKPGEKIEYKEFTIKKPNSLPPETIKQTLAEAGIFSLIRQRPYDIIASPQDTPRDIFVTGFFSAPLAPDADFLLKGNESDFQTGLDALSVVTGGKVYLGIRSSAHSSALKGAKNVEVVAFDGPHPAGNASVQINHIRPVDKGDTVWTLDLTTVIFIGRLFNRGIVDLTRLVALTGSEVKKECRAYYPMLPGASIERMVQGNVTPGINLRYISSDVLTGTRIPANGALHAFDNQITVIPEGDETNEFAGWIMPRFNQFSVSKTYPAFLLNAFGKREYTIDSRIKGGQRAMIMSNEWDKVFPMDILPEFLIRSIIAFDIDKMENLGIYEVAPEDFALCEFVDTSKMELQHIVRKGLDLLYKEMA